ncbi:MAG: hypothetical protein R2799_03860 [Crocinitomicaceae bacterium]
MEFELTTKDKYRVDFYLYRKTKDSTNSNLEFISKGSTAGSGSTGMNLIMVSLENFQEPIEVKPSEQYLILFNCFDMKKSRFDLNIAVNTDFGGLIKYNKIVDLTF